MDNKTYDLRFQHPFTMQVTGGTGAGKTEAVKKIILNRAEMIHPVPELVTFAYGEYQSAYDNIPDVNFVRGLDESMVSRETLNNKSLLLIIDDLYFCSPDVHFYTSRIICLCCRILYSLYLFCE